MKVSTHYQIVCLYPINICTIFLLSMIFLEYAQLQFTKLSNEFLLIYTHQDLLHMPHPLF